MHALRCSCCNIRPTAGARLHCRCCNIRPVKVNCRNISLNAIYLVLLKNGGDKNQFLYLTRQAYPEDSHSLYDAAYRDATRQPHGYLILDFAQDTDDKLRFRTNVFPDEGPPIVYAPVNDETHKVQLPQVTQPQRRSA